jgi:hypothetical protein
VTINLYRYNDTLTLTLLRHKNSMFLQFHEVLEKAKRYRMFHMGSPFVSPNIETRSKSKIRRTGLGGMSRGVTEKATLPLDGPHSRCNSWFRNWQLLLECLLRLQGTFITACKLPLDTRVIPYMCTEAAACGTYSCGYSLLVRAVPDFGEEVNNCLQRK